MMYPGYIMSFIYHDTRRCMHHDKLRLWLLSLLCVHGTTDCDIVILLVQSGSHGLELPKGNVFILKGLIPESLLESSLPAFDVKLTGRCFSQKAAAAASILQLSYIHKPTQAYQQSAFTSDTCPFPACLDRSDKLMFDSRICWESPRPSVVTVSTSAPSVTVFGCFPA